MSGSNVGVHRRHFPAFLVIGAVGFLFIYLAGYSLRLKTVSQDDYFDSSIRNKDFMNWTSNIQWYSRYQFNGGLAEESFSVVKMAFRLFPLLKIYENNLDLPKTWKMSLNTAIPIVTAASSNHWDELVSLVKSSQKSWPKSKIFLYNLGLSKKQQNDARSFCNVEVRRFNFSKYPGYVANLQQYRWKILIIAEVLSSGVPQLWWADSSIRWAEKTDLGTKLKEVQTQVISGVLSPMILLENTHVSDFSYTHPGLYEYFPSNQTALTETPMFAGGYNYVSFLAFHDIIAWQILCALETDCMAPSGSKLHCGHQKKNHSTWSGCHRFDQSSINIILANKYNFNHSKYFVDGFGKPVRGVPFSGKPPLKC